MVVAVSSLSVAIQGIADFLDDQLGEEINITVAHPQRASEITKASTGDNHFLNVFAYRVAPSGFHADVGSDQTHFLRINALLTPFPNESATEAEDFDIRILGHAIRALQSHPVLPITAAPLPGAAITQPTGRKSYRLEAILLAPPMEEMNHIWTTQGGELAYRLSAAYEFALIPIEPLEPRIDAAPPETLVIDSASSLAGAELSFNPISSDTRVIPVGDGETAPPTAWLPVQMLVDGDTLTNHLQVADDSADVRIAIAGPADEQASVIVTWTLADESTEAQPEQIFTIGTALIDHDEAQNTLTLAIPATAVSAVITARAAEGGAGLPGSPLSNALTLSVSAP